MRRLLPLCLAVAVTLGATAPPALAAAPSTTRATTTPSLTGSFPLGSHRLHRSASARSRSAPAGHVSQSQTSPSPSATPRPAASGTPGTIVWILIVLGAVGLTVMVTWYGQRRVMTRRAQRADAAGETSVAQATPDAVPEPEPEPEAVTVKFLLYQDNGGGYYWTIVDDGDEVIARSAGFASYPEANYAADMVHRAAATARFENRSGTTPPPRPLASAGGATKGDGAAPEPSSNPGGSVSREEVTRRAKAAGAWPAGSSSTPGGRRR
jgi:uncharacterized protein YegP (UPF0339 family)